MWTENAIENYSFNFKPKFYIDLKGMRMILSLESVVLLTFFVYFRRCFKVNPFNWTNLFNDNLSLSTVIKFYSRKMTPKKKLLYNSFK